jgi:drug/metabolite transporter (DMT)-like permease
VGDHQLDLNVFLVVILAAGLHATWNALVKGGKDKHLGMTAIVIGHVPFALLAQSFLPWPAVACWPYLIGGAFLHIGYQLFLIYAYRIGDFTQVYPIARGTAPIIVAGVSVALLGIPLLPLQLLAIFTIGAGIISLCLVRGHSGDRNKGAASVALATACFIAGYSLVDGLGARLAGTAVGYYSCQTILNAVVFAGIMAIHKPGLLKRVIGAEGRVIAIGGGGVSFVAYALVVWAFTQAPIALVTALRETSIVFALLIGVVVLKENLSLTKVASTFTTVFGAALLKLAR